MGSHGGGTPRPGAPLVDGPDSRAETFTMRVLFLATLFLGLVAAASCAREGRAPASPPPAAATSSPATQPAPSAADTGRYPQVTPVTPVQGRVVFLHARLRFVIVDFAFHQMPRLEQRLGVFRAGRRVGEVRISGPVEGTRVVADVMSGEAAVGDRVRAE